ncbi:MAG: transposase [Pseudomonadota bacterium]
MDTNILEAPGRRVRRRHSGDFKTSIIRACQQPGVTMASVALVNGLNATMVRKWVVEAEGGSSRQHR